MFAAKNWSFMHFYMIGISKHNIMLLATLLLRIYPNYVLYGMYKIGDCLYLIVLTWFYHTSCPSFYVNFLLHMGISYADIFCPQIFPSINNIIIYFKMYADEMQQVIEIKIFFSSFFQCMKYDAGTIQSLIVLLIIIVMITTVSLLLNQLRSALPCLRLAALRRVDWQGCLRFDIICLVIKGSYC